MSKQKSLAVLKRQKQELVDENKELLRVNKDLKFFVGKRERMAEVISKKSKECQLLQQRIDDDLRRFKEVRRSVESAKDMFVTVDQEARKVFDLIDQITQAGELEKEKTSKVIRSRKINLDKIKQSGSELEKENKKLKVEILKDKEVKKELIKTKASIKKKKEESRHLNQDNRTLKARLKEEEVRLEKARTESGTAYDAAVLALKSLDGYYEWVKQYVSAIVKWHVEKGLEPPEIFHNWKPKLVIYTQKTHKKLKNKEKNVVQQR